MFVPDNKSWLDLLSVFADDNFKFLWIRRIDLATLGAIGGVVPNNTPIPGNIPYYLVGYPIEDDATTG